MVYPVKQLATVVMEKLQGRIRGIEIRFRDRRTPLRIMRADPAMTNAKEFIEAVLYRMSRVRELDAKMLILDGQPLVRNIHWKGEEPSVPPGKTLKLLLCCLILMALMAGTITGFGGLAEQERRSIGSVPPQEITVQSLIDNGPGANLHVTLTDFQPGGFAFESKSQSKTWTQVWIALFPAGARPEAGQEIKVVLSSNAVRDAGAVQRLVQSGRVTGICSDSPRSGWGTALGPQIVEANKGMPLSSAWEIAELRDLPTESLVTTLLWSSIGSFATVVLSALLIFWKGS